MGVVVCNRGWLGNGGGRLGGSAAIGGGWPPDVEAIVGQLPVNGTKSPKNQEREESFFENDDFLIVDITSSSSEV